MVWTVDSYSEANFSGISWSIQDVWPNNDAAFGQTFKTPNELFSYKLTTAKFYLMKDGAPDAVLKAMLYAHTGTYGTDGLPTGSVLATSNPVEADTLGGAHALVTFTFDGTYALLPNAAYCIVIVCTEKTTLDGGNYVRVGCDNTAPTHAGRTLVWGGSSWSVVDITFDVCFYVLSDSRVAINYDTWVITPGQHGTCSPTGSQSLLVDTLITATPATGYANRDLKVDGVNQGNDNGFYTTTYALPGGATHTLEAVFEKTHNLLDSYPTTNADGEISINCVTATGVATYSCQGVSFTTPSYDATLDRLQFYLKNHGSPTGHLQAKLYAHTGTYGTSSLPTGTALAESEIRDISTIPTSSTIVNFKFTGANKVALTPNTHYCIAVHAIDGVLNSTNYVVVWRDTSGPTHSGNSMAINNTGWVASAWDRIFYVYGELLDITDHAYADHARAGYARASVYNPKFDDTLRKFEHMKEPDLFTKIKKMYEKMS